MYNKQELDDLKIEQKQNEAKHQLHTVIEEKKVHIQKLTNELSASSRVQFLRIAPSRSSKRKYLNWRFL